MLTAVQIIRARRTYKSSVSVADDCVASLANKQLIKAMKLVAWTIMLLALIMLGGHYLGVALFMFILLKFVKGKEVFFALAVSASVTLILFILFEIGFDIELYRGLIYRALNGYKLF